VNGTDGLFLRVKLIAARAVLSNDVAGANKINSLWAKAFKEEQRDFLGFARS
jgi:hypothetical protein